MSMHLHILQSPACISLCPDIFPCHNKRRSRIFLVVCLYLSCYKPFQLSQVTVFLLIMLSKKITTVSAHAHIRKNCSCLQGQVTHWQVFDFVENWPVLAMLITMIPYRKRFPEAQLKANSAVADLRNPRQTVQRLTLEILGKHCRGGQEKS